MKIQYWPIEESLSREAQEHYRTRFALELRERPADEIVRAITFDNICPRINAREMARLFDFVEKYLLKNKLSGTGLEVGAGPATFSSLLATRSDISRMYAVELCANIVEQLMPKVTKAFLGDRSEKVEGVVGSFDDMKIAGQSIDFIFDYYSLHHSNNLSKTLAECYRILKPGGILLCFDKARPDWLSDEQLNQLVDQDYGDKYKREFGLDITKPHTRRMNGEHEFREADWVRLLTDNGFAHTDVFHLEKTNSGSMPARVIKTMISFLPFLIQYSLAPIFQRKKRIFSLSGNQTIFCPQLNNFGKDMSVIIAVK